MRRQIIESGKNARFDDFGFSRKFRLGFLLSLRGSIDGSIDQSKTAECNCYFHKANSQNDKHAADRRQSHE